MNNASNALPRKRNEKNSIVFPTLCILCKFGFKTPVRSNRFADRRRFDEILNKIRI